jgi:3-hydroxyacyl-[acyl-carrier-protein] dehydratase
VNIPDTDSIRVNAAAGTAEASLHVHADAGYLKDHFPGAPMMPGLLMLEVCVRAAAALWVASHPQMAGAVLEHLERLQVVRRVVPGETLRVEVARAAAAVEEAGRARFAAVGSVGGEMALRAKFRLRAVEATPLSLGAHGG